MKALMALSQRRASKFKKLGVGLNFPKRGIIRDTMSLERLVAALRHDLYKYFSGRWVL